MIEAILQQTDENKKYQMVVYEHLNTKKMWCECCGEQGHKFYECPEKLLGTGSSIYCSICGSSSHPSYDCPEKSKQQNIIYSIEKKQKVDVEITPEEELHNFL